MGDLTPIITVAGIAAVTWLVETAMEKTGHGDKVVFVRLVGYGTAAYYSFRVWFGYMRKVASMFGVFV